MNNSIESRSCCICGFPESVLALVRIGFADDGRGMTVEMFVGEVQLLSPVATKSPKPNDSLVCVNCIRGIKRIPFSELDAAEAAR